MLTKMIIKYESTYTQFIILWEFSSILTTTILVSNTFLEVFSQYKSDITKLIL